MRTCLLRFLFAVLISSVLVLPTVAAGPPTEDLDIILLRKAGIETDNASLLGYLRVRSHTAPSERELARLIRDLGADAFVTRQTAMQKLIALEKGALSTLLKQRDDADLEVRQRVQTCLREIDRRLCRNSPYSVIRVLVKRRVPGASAALLGYLPYTNDADAEEQIYYGLDGLCKDKREQQALRQALVDREGARRAVAGCILGRVGTDEDKAVVRKLLRDPDPLVQLRSAQGLLAGRVHDKKIITTFIELLNTRSAEIAWQAEELLHYVAGETAPEATVGAHEEKRRQRCISAWRSWWTAREAAFDWNAQHLEKRRPALFLLCTGQREARMQGAVYLYGGTGKVRWTLSTEAAVSDVQFLPGDRLLTLEWAGFDATGARVSRPNALSERRLIGSVIWRKVLEGENEGAACHFRRWYDGRLFIANPYEGWAEWDHARQPRQYLERDGAKWSRYEGACKLPSGVTVAKHDGNASHLHFLDPERRDCIRSIPVPEFMRNRRYRLRVKPTSNGNLLLVAGGDGKLCEVTSTGHIVWRLEYPQQFAASVPMGDDRTLLIVQHPIGRLLEITRLRKGIWESQFPAKDGQGGYLCNFKRCLPLVTFGFPARKEPGDDIDGLEHQIELLRHPSARMRQKALRLLVELRPNSPAVITQLIATLADKNQSVGYLAESALIAIGADTVPLLLDGIKERDPLVVTGCLSVIGCFKDQAAKALPELLAVAHSSDARVRQTLLSVLGKLGPRATIAIPTVVSAVKDPDESVQTSAITTLGSIQANSKEAITALLNCLGDENEAIQRLAADSLKEIGKQHPTLFRTLTTNARLAKKLETRKQCLLVLRDVGPPAKKVLPDLLAMLRGIKTPAESQQVDEIRAALIEAIGGVGPIDQEAALEFAATLAKPTSSHSLRLWALVILEENTEGALVAREFLRALVNATHSKGKTAIVAMLHMRATRELEQQLKQAPLVRTALRKAATCAAIKEDEGIYGRVLCLIDKLK